MLSLILHARAAAWLAAARSAHGGDRTVGTSIASRGADKPSQCRNHKPQSTGHSGVHALFLVPAVLCCAVLHQIGPSAAAPLLRAAVRAALPAESAPPADQPP